MNTESAAGLLHDLADTCAGESEPDRVLAAGLPLLLELTEARAVLAVRREVAGLAVAASAGEHLDPRAALADADIDEATPEQTALPVPAEWAQTGITRATLRRLPGHAAALVLAWDTDELPSQAWLDLFFATLDAAVARAQAATRLADLIARVDNAQQLANMGDYDWHIATDTNTWSDQLYRIYGHQPQSFNASYERFLSHIHPDDRERISAIHQKSYASGEPYEMVERIVRPDGEVRYLASNGQVIRDATDTPVRMRGTCIDITDRILAEQAREHSAALFRGLVESSQDAILVVDAAGAIVQANGHASQLLGGAPDGRDISELVSWPATSAEAVAAAGFDGRPLQLDIAIARLSDIDDEGLTAAFLRDAGPRLAGEALAATLREAVVRRRQALEINDNVVQGLTAAVLTLEDGDLPAATSYVARTLAAARRMMNDWLQPLDGQDLRPGDLVRASHSTLDEPPAEVVEVVDSNASTP